jgi:hypothetical protein
MPFKKFLLSTLLTFSSCSPLEETCELSTLGDEIPPFQLYQETNDALSFIGQSDNSYSDYNSFKDLFKKYNDNPKATLKILRHSKSNLTPLANYETIALLAHQEISTTFTNREEKQCYLEEICNTLDDINSRNKCLKN